MTETLVMPTFLTADEIAELTGRKRKSDQAIWLRANGVPHWINAAGRPVVPRSAIDGQAKQSNPWVPKPLRVV